MDSRIHVNDQFEHVVCAFAPISYLYYVLAFQ